MLILLATPLVVSQQRKRAVIFLTPVVLAMFTLPQPLGHIIAPHCNNAPSPPLYSTTRGSPA